MNGTFWDHSKPKVTSNHHHRMLRTQEKKTAVRPAGEIRYQAQGDKHSTPSAQSSRNYRSPTMVKEGDDHLTPSMQSNRNDKTLTLNKEGDEHSAPSPRKQRSIETQPVDDYGATAHRQTHDGGNKISISSLGWFGTQVTQFVETMVCKDKGVQLGTSTNTNTPCKTNIQGQTEFSFFL